MPNQDESCGLTLAELEQRLRVVEPAARLVPPRVLRRVIKRDRQLPGIGLRVPHRGSHVISRDRLLTLVAPEELGDAADLPPLVILIGRPEPESLVGETRGDILARYWRTLFHMRVHVVLDRQLTDAEIGDRLEALGTAEVAEVRSVLRQEQYLLGEDDRSVYVELSAVYLELSYFNPYLLGDYFPGLVSDRVEAMLGKDLDAAGLLAATRPAGAADLPKRADPAEEEADEEESDAGALAPLPSPAGQGQHQRLMRRADRAAERGNLVRAAVLRMRAAQTAPSGYAARARSIARADLNRLVRRFQRVLAFKTAEVRPLRRALPALLEPAARGIWSVQARLLYDLQKACVDHERAVYQVDPIGWLFSLGRRPLKRLLPGQEEALSLKHLRGALGRLAATRLPDADRRRLASMLQRAITREETRLRERFRPLIAGTLEQVGLRPGNLPEQVACNKLIEELLDRVIERGYLAMGDLRDALSRNQLKLPDLDGVGEFVGGDPLIRANRHLADRLAGTYHKGEIYLRGLQRLSAAAFGTRPGRFLTLYLALPFGGAFMVLKGLEEVIDECVKLLPGEGHAEVRLLNGYSFAWLGVFLFLLLHMPAFRRGVSRCSITACRGLRWLLLDLPLGFARLPLVRDVFGSPLFQCGWQYIWKPLAVAAPLSLAFPALGAGNESWAIGGTSLFLAITGLLNTRSGRNLEETAVDWLVHRWEQLRLDIVPGLLRLVIAVFRRGVEEVERVMYTVDEWLRFRAGDSRLSWIGKLVLGLGWSALAYLIRVFINLFIEPTFNPIKHFPVVTVTAKLIVPAIPNLISAITTTLAPVMGKALAGVTAALVIFFIPGLAGFLVWELKENWRLYRANRPRTLRPVLIGHHGETLPRLLRPGLHSGTVPKLFARLRKARRTGRWAAYFKQRDALRHVEEALRHFVQREFLTLLEASGSPIGTDTDILEITLSTNRVRIELSPSVGPLDFTEANGQLTVKRTDLNGSDESRPAVAVGLAGLYRLSGVAAIREKGIDVALEPISWEQWVETWEKIRAARETAVANPFN